MKYKIQLLLFIVIAVTSCKKNASDYESKIIGDWVIVDNPKKYDKDGHAYAIPPGQGNFKVGYSFLENGFYEYKHGFYRQVKASKNQESYAVFLGNHAKYRIENDSLSLYDIGSDNWNSYKIVSLKSDTLTILDSEGERAQFVKRKYNVDQSQNFDQIIISSNGCYGTCPVSSISIQKNGLVLYNGELYSRPIGIYQSSIDADFFAKIETDFQKANWSSLKSEYRASHTDDETITITFVKNGKILKTISDYGNESPTEFCWAYNSLRNLQQRIKLKLVEKDVSYLDFRAIGFETKNERYTLEKSESFYLMTLLLNAKVTTAAFEKKYTIEYWGNDVMKKFFSDGRFYQFKLQNGKLKTLDLGFNFLQQNDLMKRSEVLESE